MHVQSCCFANIDSIAFLTYPLPSPSSLLKLPNISEGTAFLLQGRTDNEKVKLRRYNLKIKEGCADMLTYVTEILDLLYKLYKWFRQCVGRLQLRLRYVQECNFIKADSVLFSHIILEFRIENGKFYDWSDVQNSFEGT